MDPICQCCRYRNRMGFDIENDHGKFCGPVEVNHQLNCYQKYLLIEHDIKCACCKTRMYNDDIYFFADKERTQIICYRCENDMANAKRNILSTFQYCILCVASVSENCNFCKRDKQCFYCHPIKPKDSDDIDICVNCNKIRSYVIMNIGGDGYW